MDFTSILSAIEHHAKAQPDKLCVADASGEELTYSQFWQRICGAAELLLEKGIKRGDRIVAKAAQSVKYLVMLHAAQLVGAVFVPLEKNVAAGRIDEIILRTHAVLFTGDKVLDGIDCLDFRSVERTADKAPCELLDSGDTDAMILFTTGTTGKSKGIVLSYASEVAVAENIIYGVQMKKNNIELLPMPLNHSMCLRRYYANMLNGSSALLIDGVVFIKVFFNMLDKYKATSIALAPSALPIIFRLSEDRLGDYKNQLDYLQLGSAALPEDDKQKLLSLLPDSRLYNMYGSTEAGCACILNFNSTDNRPHCIGYPTKNSHFILTDAEGNAIEADNKSGETVFLSYGGSMCMEGYLDEPELTANTVVNGYIHTSDTGKIDAEGRIYMLGRADDVIISGGNKISPEEIEEAAQGFPGVGECACAGVDDAMLGKVPVLFVVTNGELDATALNKHLKNKLEGYKVPKRILTVPQLARTYNGKLLRKALAASVNN